MAERHTERSGAKRQEVRNLIRAYVDLTGPGGITAYVPPQDLLVLTDFDTVLVLLQASKVLPMYSLRAVTDYSVRRREYPGAHILSQNQEWASTDIRNKSLLSDKSIHVMEICALAQAQKALTGEEFRHRLLVKAKKESHVSLVTVNNVEIHVSRQYYETLLSHNFVNMSSGVFLPENEPTRTWADLPLQDKGVFFEAHNFLYGLAMPYADIQRNRPQSRDQD